MEELEPGGKYHTREPQLKISPPRCVTFKMKLIAVPGARAVEKQQKVCSEKSEIEKTIMTKTNELMLFFWDFGKLKQFQLSSLGFSFLRFMLCKLAVG